MLVGLVHVGVPVDARAQANDTVSGNPIIRDLFTADPAGLTHDGRMYIYTGRDEAAPTQNNFVMREWHAVSSATPTNEPDVWEHHGVLLSLADFDWGVANAWAAEVVQGPDGRFYWYVSIQRTGAPPGTDAMSIGVAVAHHPLGSYEDAIGGPLITGTMPNASSHNIDPSVIVDEDHGIFMYWGSFWSPRYARLKDNMIELDSEILTPRDCRSSGRPHGSSSVTASTTTPTRPTPTSAVTAA